MTQMACTDPATTAQETAITTGLPKVTDSTLSGTTLTMQDSSGDALFTWTRGPSGIEGTYTVTGINNGNQAVVSTEATSKASITFGPDGVVSGNTGCNSFSGSYTLDGSSLEINGDVAATMMACEDASQQVETQFLTALSEVASWERTGQTVTLRDHAGAIQITLTQES
jgi:heat shock protein HslJ